MPIKYHINPNTNKVGRCKAKNKCEFASQFPDLPHYNSYRQAQIIANNMQDKAAEEAEKAEVKKDIKEEKQVIENENLDNHTNETPIITTETSLFKHSSIGEILKSKNYQKQLDNIQYDIDKLVHKAGSDAYKSYCHILKQKKKRPIPKDKFLDEYRRTDPDVQFLINKKNRIIKEIISLNEYRNQAYKSIKDTESYILDKSYSKASCSTYVIYKPEKLDEIIQYYEKEGYEVNIRPDIKEALGNNFLLRLSDHNPKGFIRSKDENKNVWDYTDASILVTLKNNDEIKYNHSNAISALRNIEKLNRGF